MKIEGHNVKVGRIIRKGKFVSGTKYDVTNSIVVDGKKFKKGQIVHWFNRDDPMHF